ncbi:MAG TPA: FxLYD domain-containing protein [Thermoanaerobaculaceae bacterium]|nr:FxLYD domain-containing protein [Thermoanaerobaculaceae bacterium]
MLLATLVLAVGAQAATVVLTGGKRLDVSAYSVSGSYVTVHYANGRQEWYPLAAVDLAATRAASGQTAAPPAAAVDSGPHSPFLGARASTKPGGLVVTDADVKHIDTEAAGEEAKKADQEAPLGGQVVLVSYEKKLVGKNEWAITATVANQGKDAVQNVSALVRVLDAKGKPVTTGSSSVLGKLDPGKQGTITARVALDSEPPQVAVDLSWQEIKPVPTPAAKQVPAGAPKPPGQASMPAAPAPAAGSPTAAAASPNSLPPNMMAVVSPTAMGSSPQVPPQSK